MHNTIIPQNQGCRFVSWNVRGVNGAIKRGKVISHMRQLKGDIYFLQETHLKTSEISRIKRPWMSHVFHSKFSMRARGAAIIVSQNIIFEPTKSIEDPNGRFVAVSGRLFDIPVILVSAYAPVWDDDKFITHLFSSFPDIDGHYPIIGGDFNLIQDPVLDRSSARPLTLSNSAAILKSFLNQLGPSDPWRSLNPSSKAFSFFSHVHRTYSRIDFFLVDNRLLHWVSSSEYHCIVISDHAPTSVVINFPNHNPPHTQWKFSHFLLNNPNFKKFF